MKWRWVVAVGIVAGTTALLLTALNNDSDGPPLTTLTVPTSSTSTTTTLVTTTTEPVTSTATEEQRLAEVEALLQNLWFGWFDAIYRKDEEALWTVVATTQRYEAGVAAMETMEFVSPPTVEGIRVQEIEILLDRADCLVVYDLLDLSAIRGPGVGSPAVDVLWPDKRYGWRLATSWIHRGDIWINDCDNLERERTP